ncbi:MAG: hypothetical protein ACRDQ5_05410 [Sciscionella sp.]
MRGTAEHVRRLRRCAHALAADQDASGGWGLTRSQPPSLVNTAEALMVLDAAREPRAALEAGLAYLTRNVADHCTPRETGGRGEKTRYVAFTLWGLASCGHDQVDGLADAITWILAWLDDHRQNDGWSEVAGTQDCSLFETALITRGLGRLLRRSEQDEFGLDSRQRQRARDLLGPAINGILLHKLRRGWPQRAYTSKHSPAKTAWCLLGLAEVIQVDNTSLTGLRRVAEVIHDEVDVLSERCPTWRRRIEVDPDVVATVWSHLAYLLCLEAITACGGPATAAELLPAWNDLDGAWNEAQRYWLELTTPAVPTVRATCYSVLALEALRYQYGEHGLATIGGPCAANDVDGDDALWELRVHEPGDFSLFRPDRAYTLELSPVHRRLLVALAGVDDPRGVVPSPQLAAAVGVKASSLGVAVSRLNAAVTRQVADFDRRLVVADRGKGYRLNVARTAGP